MTKINVVERDKGTDGEEREREREKATKIIETVCVFLSSTKVILTVILQTTEQLSEQKVGVI